MLYVRIAVQVVKQDVDYDNFNKGRCRSVHVRLCLATARGARAASRPSSPVRVVRVTSAARRRPPPAARGLCNIRAPSPQPPAARVQCCVHVTPADRRAPSAESARRPGTCCVGRCALCNGTRTPASPTSADTGPRSFVERICR
ncbi:hypothetical protein EVAR_77166_1 [Eumeta japonica]|uniref:Uncharacterized protein n=1 Tax=Eumeta variegata TaxID=151549 RepID=A0A4C1T2N3_EUMVA|nr:hypothetical protein EVAR_77166_1 [Eumeta japonica]